MLTIGDKFPSFSLKGVKSNEIKNAFSQFTEITAVNKWQIMFFYPKDFTFVCPTELIAFNNLKTEFTNRNTEIYGVSIDSEFVHLEWRKSNPDLSKLQYPLLSDIKRELSSSLGILHNKEGVCLRATFIIDPKLFIRHVSVNDLTVGRNPKEILRIIDALQTDELTPCNWNKGDSVIKI
jgi:alkyl hydroperoxide reductase subunit AhpC